MDPLYDALKLIIQFTYAKNSFIEKSKILAGYTSEK